MSSDSPRSRNSLERLANCSVTSPKLTDGLELASVASLLRYDAGDFGDEMFFEPSAVVGRLQPIARAFDKRSREQTALVPSGPRHGGHQIRRPRGDQCASCSGSVRTPAR